MPLLRLRRALATAVVGAALAVVASACSTSDATEGGNGYIAGNGTVQTFEPSKRQDAPDVKGATIDGTPLDLADDLGKVVVINVWASWCGECRGEADDLAEAYHRLPRAAVAFLGIDTSEDSTSAAVAFQRNHPVPYPSLYDDDGSVLLGFYGLVRPDALPSTLVIDQEGRIAALVSGPIDRSTLVGLVQDVERES